MAFELGDLAQATPVELCRAYRAILEELRHEDRDRIMRTWNAPVGEYAEYLVARHVDGDRASNSAKGVDVIAGDMRIQVKCRIVSTPALPGESSLGAIRSWSFSHLAVVLFEASDFSIRRAAIAPREVVESWNAGAVYAHTNASTIRITVARLDDPRCTDITSALQQISDSLPSRSVVSAADDD